MDNMGLCDATGPSLDGITFASALDAARYRALSGRRQELQAQLDGLDRELEALLRRATWSVEAILAHDG